MTRTVSEAADGDRLLLAVARQGIWWLALLAGASLAENAALLLLPAAIGQAINAILARSGTDGHIAACVLLVVVIVVADAATDLASGISGAMSTGRLRRALAAHIVNLGPRLFTSFGSGDTVSRLVGGAADAGTGPASVVLAVAAVIPPIGSVVALGLIDPWLVVAFAVGFPVLAVVLHRLVRDSSGAAVGYARAQGDIAARLLDALTGARTIAAAGTQRRERDRVLAPLGTLREHGYASWRIQARAAAQGSIIAPALQVIVVAVAGVELASHQISAGDLVAASQYAVLAVGVGASVGLVSRLGRARAGATRAAEPLAVPPVAYGTRELPPGRGELRMTGVSVRHGDDDVLRDLDLTVPAGAVVAVVGRSGAGKSTLARLAGRLADPDAGTVTIDGADLRELTRSTLRASVVYAFERPELIGATSRDAISFGLARPTDQRLRTAVGQAQADGFLARLPRQLDTPLADAPLSGGEAQRLGLARAFAHAGAARLLVLDDATSSLDTVTELLVARAITQELTGRTRLIVAHRAATAARADLVAWLDDGRIRGLAPHWELWADGEYRGLFGMESGMENGMETAGC